MNGVPVILSFRARNKNCVERLRTLHPDNFSSFRILSSQRILSGHLILIPSALRNYSIMGHYSPGTISFLQILREDCPTIGKVKKVNLCSNTVWKRSRITAPIVGILWHRGIWEGFIRFYCIKARPGGLPGLHSNSQQIEENFDKIKMLIWCFWNYEQKKKLELYQKMESITNLIFFCL